MWEPPPRPPWVARLNATGEGLGGPEHLIPLEERSVLDAARQATGLDDFGPDTWREAFRVLVESLRAEAGLNTVGHLLVRSELVRWLENRLRVARALADHPEIGEGAERISAPVFIVGLARSGTSILHELLAQDPANRVPLTWEVMFPLAEPALAGAAVDRALAASGLALAPAEPGAREEARKAGAAPSSDPRIGLAERAVTLWHEIAPEYLTMHENGGELPAECIFLMAQEFRSNHFTGCHAVASYARWLASNGLGPAYAYHRRLLQLLQWQDRRDPREPPPRWLLKAPSHLSTLPALFAEYPDARIILTHRDPLEALPSTISLVATLRWMRSDRVDVAMLARELPAGIAASLERVAEQRSRGILPDGQFFDLRYADLMRDPFAAVAAVYRWLEAPLPDEVRRRMTDYLARKPKGRHGAHAYSLTDFALDPNAERTRFAAYRSRIGLPDVAT